MRRSVFLASFLIWSYCTSSASGAPGVCQVRLTPPALLLNSTFRLEARLIGCQGVYRVYFNINGKELFSANSRPFGTVKHRFVFERSYPVNLLDVNKVLEAIARPKNFGEQVLRSGQQEISVVDRPVFVKKRPPAITALPGSPVRINVIVRSWSAILKGDVRLLESASAEANAKRSEVVAKITITALAKQLTEVGVEFQADDSCWLQVEIRSKLFTERSPIIKLDVIKDIKLDVKSPPQGWKIATMTLIFIVVLSLVCGLAALLWKVRCGKEQGRMENYTKNGKSANRSLISSGAIADTTRPDILQMT